MKALSIKQPWANFILDGSKTIEIKSWQTLYRGDLLICASQTPASFLKKTSIVDSEGRNKVVDKEFEVEEYMYFGKGLFIAELYDIQPMKKEDEDQALADLLPECFSWFLRNVRPVILFEVTGRLNLFDVSDLLIILKQPDMIAI